MDEHCKWNINEEPNRTIRRGTNVTNSEKPGRRIVNVEDIEMWLHSEAYRDFLNFIKQLNEFAKGVHNRAFQSRDEVNNIYLKKVVSMLDHLYVLCDQIEPLNDDKGQRFGNKAYRIWFDEMIKYTYEELIRIFGEQDGSELALYISDSFGNKVRIDYGTGHEMCFVIFLMGIYKLILIPNSLKQSSDDDTLSRDVFQSLSHQLLNIFALVYIPLVRKIQLRYRLEPAGSHGAFSLDDFQFLPFYFGSAQLIDHPNLYPSSFPQQNIAEQYKNVFIFYAAINFIHQVKNGPFAEHSNQLWNISGVQDWSKINNGLFKMYCKEYLPKFQIVQHLVFGPRILNKKLEENEFFLQKTLYRWLGNEQSLLNIEDIKDQQSTSQQGEPSLELYKFEYHIIYNVNYQTPVLYFNICDEYGRSVTFEWLWQRLPNFYSEQITKATSNKNVSIEEIYKVFGEIITQTNHPILGHVVFMVHPCKTNNLMANILSCDHCNVACGHQSSTSYSKERCTYLITWLSSLASYIGLPMPLQYGMFPFSNKISSLSH